MADVQPEPVRWLWSNRIPVGKLTLIEGDPGVAKSWLTLALATALTTAGALPDDQGSRSAGDVLLLSAEDGLADTVRPRLDALGADVTRVHVLQSVADRSGREREPSLISDLGAIEQTLASGDYRLVVVDPVNAYLGTKLDANRDTEIRAVLMPLARLAERAGVAVLGVRHLTKGGRDRAIYRGQGSIGYTAAARVVLLVGQDPDEPGRRVVVPIKNNLAPLASALAFEIADGRFLWCGESRLTAAALLAPDASAEQRTARDDAADFLRDLLADGPVAAQEAEQHGKDAGISSRTLRRARSQLGVKLTKAGYQGRWEWSLKDGHVNPLESWPPFKNEFSQVKDGHLATLSKNGHLSEGETSQGPE
jgi:hypothetical protein